MQTIVLLSIIGLIIVFIICTVLLIILLNAYKRIKELKKQLLSKKQENEKYINKIKEIIGDNAEQGFNLGERK